MEVNLKLSKILEIVDGASSSVDSSFLIKNIKSLESAGPNDLAVIIDRGDASVFDAISLDKIKNSKAAVLLSSTPDVPNKNYIIVKDSVAAFSKLTEYLYKIEQDKIESEKKQTPEISPEAFIDPTAVICAGAKIGAKSVIKAQVFIGQNCIIGCGVLIHPGAKILDKCIVGDGSIIHSGAIIGSDGFGYTVTKQGMRKIPQIGIVRIGRMVEIGANCTIDRASFDETVIGDGVKMDNLVHIAHNVKIGAATAILAQTGIAGSVQIGIGCQIGGQVGIKNDTKIGNGVKIASKSAVMNDLEDGQTVCGIPAIQFTKWKRNHVLLQHLPEFAKFVSNAQKVMKKHESSWVAKLWGKFFKEG